MQVIWFIVVSGHLINFCLVPDYQLVIICSSEQETKSQIATAFDKFRVKGAPRCPRPEEVLAYFKNEYFKAPPTSMVHFGKHEIEWISAAEAAENHFQTDSRYVSKRFQRSNQIYRRFQNYAATTVKIYGVQFAMDCRQSNRIFVF